MRRPGTPAYEYRYLLFRFALPVLAVACLAGVVVGGRAAYAALAIGFSACLVPIIAGGLFPQVVNSLRNRLLPSHKT